LPFADYFAIVSDYFPLRHDADAVSIISFSYAAFRHAISLFAMLMMISLLRHYAFRYFRFDMPLFFMPPSLITLRFFHFGLIFFSFR